VADLGQGAQLGDLPEPIRQQLGWQPSPTSRELTTEFTPGDRIRLLPGDDPPPSSRPMPEDPTQPRYPEVQVPLSGEDGNAFAILGRTAAARARPGWPRKRSTGHQRRLQPPAADHHGLGRLAVAATLRRPPTPPDVPSGAGTRIPDHAIPRLPTAGEPGSAAAPADRPYARSGTL